MQAYQKLFNRLPYDRKRELIRLHTNKTWIILEGPQGQGQFWNMAEELVRGERKFIKGRDELIVAFIQMF